MLRAILLDLDDTLLSNNMDRFLASYFPLLSSYVKDIIPPDKFVEELMIGTTAMINDDDPNRTNSEVFWDIFCRRTGQDYKEFKALVDRFYLEEFSQLRKLTQLRPAAKQIVDYSFSQGLKVVIATNPLFPMIAIQQRLSWAGIPAENYPYSIVTAYENMHAAKPHTAYYQEILDRIDLHPHQALMIGDDWENDMVPASELGTKTYWITNNDYSNSGNIDLVDDHGSLDEFKERLIDGWFEVN